MSFAGRIALFAISALAPIHAAAPGSCKTGNQILFYSPHPLLDARTMAGFGDSLRTQLIGPVQDLGYCLEEVKDYRLILDTAKYGENLVLQTLVREGPGPGTMLVAMIRV